MGKPIGPEWWFSKPYISLPYFLLESAAWLVLTPNAKILYIEMRKVIGNGSGQFKPHCILFGPSRVIHLMDKRTYRRVLSELINAGFVREVKPGQHGAEGCYDISHYEWYSKT